MISFKLKTKELKKKKSMKVYEKNLIYIGRRAVAVGRYYKIQNYII